MTKSDITLLTAIAVTWAFMLSVAAGTEQNMSVTVTVWRRLVYDIYELSSHEEDKIDHDSCENTNQTYMVEEKMCLKNEDIIGTASRLYLPPLPRQNSMTEEVDTHLQYKDHTHCQIDSLEVRRGVEKSFKIDHSGFALAVSNGTIKVQATIDLLGYSVLDYRGELYQVKYSCYDSRESKNVATDQPIFFVIFGYTNVTYPKFNCSVPGTLFPYSSPDCLLAETTSTSGTPTGTSQDEEATSTPTPHGPQYTVTYETTTSFNSSDDSVLKDTKSGSLFEVGSPLFYAVVGAGSGVSVVFLCCLVCVCTVLIYKHNKVKVSTITNTGLERRCSVASRQTNPANEKDIELIYEMPSEVVQSNMYGCNCLEDNPAYREPGSLSRSKSEKALECDYAVIPEHENQMYEYNFTEEPIYQEIAPQECLKLTAKCDSSSDLSTVTAHNNFYETSMNLSLHQPNDHCSKPYTRELCPK